VGERNQLSVHALTHKRLDMANKNTSSCFLIGLGTGIALGVFFAPRAGSVARRSISHKAQGGMDVLRTKASAGRAYIERYDAELRDRATEAR
jgi:hypothetical protein